ncbi:hypothetical protein [Corynebacterium sp. A21]|uniref:hypothetical protein n=1 Tax=Corynebacterium sp. A21 TaxID=3457318 RepID=UPI003FCFE375
MATNSGSFFNSRGNLIGMVLAILVILVHLIVGLGFLWPVVAIAAWGASAALIPTGKPQPELAAPQQLSLNPAELGSSLSATTGKLRDSKPAGPLGRAMWDLDQSLRAILREWHYLSAYPEQQVILASMIEDYLPGIIDSYLQVPHSARHRAVSPTIDSLEVLYRESAEIRAAIGEDNVRALENHRDMLQLQFGQDPGFAPEVSFTSDSESPVLGDADSKDPENGGDTGKVR